MGSNTVRCKLGDVATFRNGAGVKQDFFTTSNDGVNLAKVSNFTSDSIDLTDATKVDREHAQKWTSHLLKSDDVLIATVGSWPPNWSSVVGKVVRAPKGSEGAIQNQNTCCVIPNQAINQSYLYYLLKTRQFSEWIVNVAQGSANQARVPVKKIGDFEFELPPIDIQRGVASTLRNLDNKITLNRQINQTLEQMAQTLFKSWFVDFDPVMDNALDAGNPIPDELQHRAEARKAVRQGRAAADKEREGFKPLPDDVRQLFPDAFEESELGWVPKGWGTRPLSDLCHLITDGAHASPKSIDGGGFPMASVKDMRNFNIDLNSCRRISEGDFRKLVAAKCRPQEGDVLIAKDGSYLKHVFSVRCELDVVLLSSIAILRPNQLVASSYLSLSLKQAHVLKRMENYVSGAVIQRIVLKDFKRFPIVLAPSTLQEQFENQVGNLFNRIDAALAEIASLEKLRDTLLPKLISGELRLDDVEAAVEQETVSA